MDHRDARLVAMRELMVLPVRGRDADIAGIEGHQERRIHDPHVESLLRGCREFGIEAEVGAARTVEELAVEDDARLGEDVLQEKRLAPAYVREDHIRSKSGAPEVHGPGGDTTAALYRACDRRVDTRLDHRRVVAEQTHPGNA